MRVAPLISLVLLASACGYSEKKFEVIAVVDFCDLNADCTQIVDSDTCVDIVRTMDRSKCDYDPKAAKDCAKLLEESSCVDNGDVGTFSLDYPEPCDLVYDGCGPLWEAPYGPVVTE